MIVYDGIIPAERAVPGGLGGNFQNYFFPLLSEWVPDEPCLSSFRLEAAPPKPRQVWSHQVVQLESSTQKKPEKLRHESKEFLSFFPLQIRTEERVRSAFCDLCNPNFPESLKSNGCI